MISLGVTNGFTVARRRRRRMILDNEAFQMRTISRWCAGSHQIALGGNVAYWTSETENYARAVGDFTFNGTRRPAWRWRTS